MDKRRSRGRNNRKREKRFNYAILFKTAIIICIVFIAVFFSLLNIGNTNIINNVYINDISVSSLSTEEAKEKVNSTIKEKLDKEILIKFEDYETTILPAEIDYTYDVPSALEKAYSIGRKGNILT